MLTNRNRKARSFLTGPPPTEQSSPLSGKPHDTYVVCLDCGKQFAYDMEEMRIGNVIDRSNDVGVLPPNSPKSRKTKLGYALLAAVPAAVVLGALLKAKKKATTPEDRQPTPAEWGETMRRED